MKSFFKFNYESEIKLSLLLLILFFVLINYAAVYLLNLSQINWKEESINSLKEVAYSASQLWQNTDETIEMDSQLKNLTFLRDFKTIEIIDQNCKVLASSDNQLKEKKVLLSGLPTEKFKENLNTGKSFLTNLYPGPEKELYQSYFYSFRDKESSKTLFVKAEKEMTKLAWIERISKYEGWVRGVGIIGVLFLAFLFLKNIFLPYQQMKKKAEEEKIISSSSKKEDVEVVVEVFQKVIAELKEKERKLQELYFQTNNKAKNLERYNEYILKSINNGVIICDNQGRITGFNQAAQGLLGTDFKLSLNLHYKETLGEKGSLSNMLNEMVVKKNLSAETEVEIEGEKGEDKFLMANSALLRDDNENIIGLVLVLTDLTELKRIQQEMAFKQNMANLGEISAGLAHELRNSMGALLGYCKMLKKGFKEGSAAYPVVEGIMAESLTLENLLKRFLDFAKPLKVKWVKFNLTELIRDCIKIAKEKRPDLKFSLKLQEEIPLLYGDPILLRQAFQNLIQNSIEALYDFESIGQDKGELKITLQEIEDNHQSFIQIEIEDNGCGIIEENIEKIFKPFFTSKEKGMGLGLSLVKKIIDLHKGTIEVQSRPNKGTIFTLLLPLTEPSSKSTSEKVVRLKEVA